MVAAEISVNELTRAEQQFVVRTFLLAIGADEELKEVADAERKVEYQRVLRAMNLSSWPTSEATEVELALSSASLCHSDFPRLRTYSVFWSFSSVLELWIGKTPRKPKERTSFLSGENLTGTIIRLYGIKLSNQQQSNWFRRVAKRNWRNIAIDVGFPVFAITAVCVYAYFRHGLALRALFPVLTFSASYLYHRFAAKLIGWRNYQLTLQMVFFFGFPYFLWDPADHLPFGTDAEYPHLAGLAAGMALGFVAMLIKSSDDEDERIKETFGNGFRSLRRYLVLMSSVTVTGYGMFLIHALAIHQIFVEGHRIFILMVPLVVVAYSAFVHDQLER